MLEVSVLEVSWRREAGGGEGEGAADTALKTKTPHDNVGNEWTGHRHNIKNFGEKPCHIIMEGSRFHMGRWKTEDNHVYMGLLDRWIAPLGSCLGWALRHHCETACVARMISGRRCLGFQ